jgi:hypothetical protein
MLENDINDFLSLYRKPISSAQKMEIYKAERRQGTLQDLMTIRGAKIIEDGKNCFGNDIIKDTNPWKEFHNYLFSNIRKTPW